MFKLIRPSSLFVTLFSIIISTFLPLTYTAAAESPSASATSFYVSPSGDDLKGDGSKEAPFKTISKARDTVRRIISRGMTSDITVYLRGGNYYLDSPIVFTKEDSGNNGFNVIYKNYEGEQPIINGGEAVTGWESYSKNIYKAKIQDTKGFSTLFENGERSYLARFPNKGAPREGYLKVAEMVNNNPNFEFKFAQGEIPVINNINDLQVNCWPGGVNGEFNWVQERHHVKSLSYDSNTITLDTRTNYEMGKGSRYFLQGALELLDSPGEFYFDSNESTLYYYPRSLPIEQQDIVYPKMMNIIEFNGASETDYIHNITIEGLCIRNSDTYKESGNDAGAVVLRNAKNITIKDCIIHNAGVHGIYLTNFAQENTIYGNLIHDVGYTGITLFGGWLTSKHINTKNRIENNHIYNIGQISGGEPGIALVSSGENIISHNLIHDGNRAAITMGSTPVRSNILGRSIDGILATEENMYDFAHSRNNVVEYNDLSRMNQDSQDSGVIYTWGPGKGNIINNNYIHDSNIYFSFGSGLYLDDESGYFTVTNNIVSNLQKAGGGTLNGAVYVKSVENKLYNNFIVNNNALIAFQTSGYTDNHGPNKDIVFEHNIISNGGKDISGAQGWADDKFASIDKNLYYNDSGIYTVSNIKKSSLEEWKMVLNRRFDQNSITEDPKFVDADKNDYRLKYNSIAHAMGIKDIDTYSIGLKEDFKYPVKNDPISRLFISSDKNGIKSFVDLNTETEKTAQLILKGRTSTGFVADLSKAQITYTSSDPSVADVTKDGLITAKKEGVATVTASVLPSNNDGFPAALQDRLKNSIALLLGCPTSFVNGQAKQLDPDNKDVVPIIVNDRTLVPLRFIAENLGGTVSYNSENKTIKIKSGDDVLILTVGSTNYNKNRRNYTMDVAPEIINGRTMVPLRAVSTALGKQVFWNKNGLIIISDVEKIFNMDNDSALVDTLIKMFPSPLSISIDVLVNDSFDRVKVYTDRTVLTTGETLTAGAFALTKFGRYLNLDDAQITFSSSNGSVVSIDKQGLVTAKALGSADIKASIKINGNTNVGTLNLNVIDAIISELTMSLEKTALAPGDTTNIKFSGKLSNGQPLKQEELKVAYKSANPDILAVDENGTVTARAEGRTSLTASVSRSGYTRNVSINVIVFSDGASSLPAPWKVKNYGNSSGTAVARGSGEFTVFSNGYDVFGENDSFTYLYQETNSSSADEVSVTAYIGPFTNTNRDASSGIMLRSGDADNSKMVHARLIPDGTCIIAFRKEAGGGCGYTVGPHFTFPEGGTLKMTKKGAKVVVEYLYSGTWQHIADIDVDLGDNIMAGVGVFSKNTDAITEAKIGNPTVEVKKAAK